MSHSQLTQSIWWGVFIGSACTQPMRCTYAHHTPAIRHRIALIAARTWDVRFAYATCARDTQWSGSHTRHHTQWHRRSYAIYAACASPMRHWYVVDTQHIRRSSAGDVPPNHLGDLTEYLFIFSYAVRAPWHRRPVEQGHYIKNFCLQAHNSAARREKKSAPERFLWSAWRNRRVARIRAALIATLGWKSTKPIKTRRPAVPPIAPRGRKSRQSQRGFTSNKTFLIPDSFSSSVASSVSIGAKCIIQVSHTVQSELILLASCFKSFVVLIY